MTTLGKRPQRLDYDPAQVRRLRVAAGLGVVEAARKAGISQPMWSEMEKGGRNASPKTLRKVADALGVQITDLMPREPVAA